MFWLGNHQSSFSHLQTLVFKRNRFLSWFLFCSWFQSSSVWYWWQNGICNDLLYIFPKFLYWRNVYEIGGSWNYLGIEEKICIVALVWLLWWTWIAFKHCRRVLEVSLSQWGWNGCLTLVVDCSLVRATTIVHVSSRLRIGIPFLGRFVNAVKDGIRPS